MSGTDALVAPVIHLVAVGIDDVLVDEVACHDRLTKLGEHLGRNGNRFDIGGHDLESGGLQDQIRIHLVQRLDVRLGPREIGAEILLRAPQHERASNELGLGADEQANVVARIDSARVHGLGEVVVEQLGEGDGSAKVLLQDRLADDRVEMEFGVGSSWRSYVDHTAVDGGVGGARGTSLPPVPEASGEAVIPAPPAPPVPIARPPVPPAPALPVGPGVSAEPPPQLAVRRAIPSAARFVEKPLIICG